jgi:hypothetical protein
MAELGWPVLEIMAEHLQNLISKGYMSREELATCHVLVDLVSPVLAAGYVITCSSLYELGFGVPSHQFLHLLL